MDGTEEDIAECVEGIDMWKIVRIFDGDYGCEELEPGEKPKVSVTLENENGENRILSVEEAWLIENHLDVDSIWKDEMQA